MKVTLVFLLIALVLTVLNGEEVELGDATTSVASELADVLTMVQLAKLPIKTLRAMLEKKGLNCKGCSEKSEYVSKVHETQQLPDVVAPEVEEPKSKPPPIDQDKMDELMAKLKMGGFGNSKMFSAEDLKNMSPEDIGAKLNNKRGGKAKRGGKSTNNKSKNKSDGENANSAPKVDKPVGDEEDGTHTIEL